MPLDRNRSSSGTAPYIITAGGGARSGKGTSMGALKAELEMRGQRITGIDQGMKFRTMALAALDTPRPVDLGDGQAVKEFLTASEKPILGLLARVATLTDEEKRALLYTSAVSEASAKVARVPSSHVIAIDLLKAEVDQAVREGVDGVIIDGRAMENYARRFTEGGLGQFAIGWHFECEPREAARRSVKVFGDENEVDPEAWRALLAEEAKIAARNQTDMQREVDPLRRPDVAYELPLPLASAEVTPYGMARSTLSSERMAVLDTTSLGLHDMTKVVLDVTAAALQHEGLMSTFAGGVEYAN